MIVAKCPLRIGLVGGSTDLEEAIQLNGRGAVISFPATIYTYISIHDDRMGLNALARKYVVNYSRREESVAIDEIKNSVARECLRALDIGPIGISFTADVSSEGSGLAASSAYTIALIKALRHLRKRDVSDYEVCAQALEVERRFNPLTGRQDSFGCGIGALKRLEFTPEGNTITLLPDHVIRDRLRIYLVHTGMQRSSTDVLKTLDHRKSARLLPLVDQLQAAINSGDLASFGSIIREGWLEKKASSKDICSDMRLMELDQLLSSDSRVIAHKLLGAGGGGYFLAFLDSERIQTDRHWHQSTLAKTLVSHGVSIAISQDGVRSQRI